METITINLINPKAKKLIDDLVGLGLISIQVEGQYSQEFLDTIDKEYEDYQKGVGINYSKEEVFSAIRKRKTI